MKARLSNSCSVLREAGEVAAVISRGVGSTSSCASSVELVGDSSNREASTARTIEAAGPGDPQAGRHLVPDAERGPVRPGQLLHRLAHRRRERFARRRFAEAARDLEQQISAAPLTDRLGERFLALSPPLHGIPVGLLELATPPDLLRDVLLHAREMVQPAVVVPDRRDGHEVPEAAAVFPVVQHLAAEALTGLQRVAHRSNRRLVRAGSLEEAAVPAQDLVGAVLSDPFERLVREDDPLLGVGDQGRVRQLAQRLGQDVRGCVASHLAHTAPMSSRAACFSQTVTRPSIILFVGPTRIPM